MATLNILGAGGHGEVCADIALLQGYKKIYFFDDTFPEKKSILNFEIKNTINFLFSNIKKNQDYIVAIGNNIIRYKFFLRLQQLHAKIINLVHPRAIISNFSTIGYGNVFCANSLLGVNTAIGNACILNHLSSVDHDCCLGNAVHVCPGVHISGGCSLGDYGWIGVGSCIKEGISVGNKAFIGAGAAVISNIPENEIFVGVPARNKNK